MTADYVRSLQLESGAVSLHLHATCQALADVHDVHASVGSFVQQSHDPWRMRGISRTEGTHHDASQIRRFHYVAYDVVLDARKETEYDHVRVESQVGYHRLVIIRSEDVVLVILEIDAHVAEMRIVERFEGVESLGIDLDGAVASDQLAVEEDAYLRHHRSAVLVLCRCYLDGSHQILLAVGTQFADRQLATGQDHRFGQVLKHEAQGR